LSCIDTSRNSFRFLSVSINASLSCKSLVAS
jgi:hypothetical protein